jgi:hypothetical protein
MHLLYKTLKRKTIDRLLIAAKLYRYNAESVRNHRTEVCRKSLDLEQIYFLDQTSPKNKTEV